MDESDLKQALEHDAATPQQHRTGGESYPEPVVEVIYRCSKGHEMKIRQCKNASFSTIMIGGLLSGAFCVRCLGEAFPMEPVGEPIDPSSST